VTVDLAALRAHVGLGPSDADLQTALDAALEAIANRYGPSDPVTEYLRPFGQWVKLGRRAEEVASVIEGGTTLDAADYAIWPGGRYLRRLSSDEPSTWTGMVEVEYTAFSEEAERDRITYALCDLTLTVKPGLASITVGPWSESYTGADPSDYLAARDAILASLRPPNVGVW
jgi:hypothetical protein